MNTYDTKPTTLTDRVIIVNNRIMIWQDNTIYKGYVYLA
jgi:hypothetical protein